MGREDADMATFVHVGDLCIAANPVLVSAARVPGTGGRDANNGNTLEPKAFTTTVPCRQD